MNRQIELLAIDADDTLWTNMLFYHEAMDSIKNILEKYTDTALIIKDLYEIETANISVLGYGTKSFIITMVEAAISLTEGKIKAHDILEIVTIGKTLFSRPVELLDNVKETLAELSQNYTLMLLTKGDLFEQQGKINCSGLIGYFEYTEIVSEKDEATYSALLQRYNIAPENFLMAGNSLKSDIFPVLNIGGNAVHIPHRSVWYHEDVPADEAGRDYIVISDISELTGLICQNYPQKKVEI